MQLNHKTPNKILIKETNETLDLPHHGYYHQYQDFQNKPSSDLSFGIYTQSATGTVDWFYDGIKFDPIRENETEKYKFFYEDNKNTKV